ncbi:MAG: hypothetical protein KBA81_08320, partial [Rhabdochlamydiaceae bacterium]|nr:hypothetical protein [Rhabdochlamydiaceae bacterium]
MLYWKNYFTLVFVRFLQLFQNRGSKNHFLIVSTTGLGDTLGGRNTGYTKKVADIPSRAQGEIDGSTVGKKNQEFKDKATQDIANLTTRAEKLNGVFGKIFEKYSQFKADGFKYAASAVRKLGFDIYRLAQSGE